ncbi:MAG: DUF3284 domain-containing protein [Traorella sp.]
MKYRLQIKANQKEYFDVYTENFCNEYYMEKGKILPKEKIVKGFTFQKNISKDKRKAQLRLATIKVLEYDYPNKYRVEYISDRYRKITGIELRQIDENQLEIIAEEVMDKIIQNENGQKEYVSEIKESDEIKKASFFKKYQYRYLARSIEIKKKYQAKKD